MTPLECRQDALHPENSLRYHKRCLHDDILCLAVLTQHRLLTDRQNKQTGRHIRPYIALAYRREVFI